VVEHVRARDELHERRSPCSRQRCEDPRVRPRGVSVVFGMRSHGHLLRQILANLHPLPDRPNHRGVQEVLKCKSRCVAWLMRVSGVSAVLSLSSCGPARAPVTSTEQSVAPRTGALIGNDTFAESSLTPFGRQLYSMIDAALVGSPLPSTWPTATVDPVVDRRPVSERGSLRPILFGAEFRVYFTPPPGQSSSEPEGVQLGVVVFEQGLRIVETKLRNRNEWVAPTLPVWLSAFDGFTQEVTAAARAGQTAGYRETEAEVRALLPPELAQPCKGRS
jgi:hypothetical protein